MEQLGSVRMSQLAGASPVNQPPSGLCACPPREPITGKKGSLFFSPLSLSLCLFLMLLMERDGIFYFNTFFSEQQKLTKNMLSHLREVNTVWKQPASARSFFSCHSQLSQSPWWEDFTLLLQSSLVNNCCHPKVKNLKTAILCHFPYKRLLSVW